MEDFRDMLARLEARGGLVRSRRPVDLRYVPALLRKAQTAVLFEQVNGYDIPVVGGLYWTRQRVAQCADWPELELGRRFMEARSRSTDPVLVPSGPCQEVVWQGDEVDLTRLPIPTLHERDGGPYISSGVVISRDPRDGRLNAGVYRLMLRSRNETGIDLVSVSDMRGFYERRLARGEPLEIAVAIGVHVFEELSAAFRAPATLKEFGLAGGMHGGPLELVQCKTVDLAVPARAEIVLEGVIEPTGWTSDEGPFGEFGGMQGETKWNPVFRVTAMTHRKNPIFFSLQMPWENDWLGGPATEAAAWGVLREAGLRPTAVRATEGGCCNFGVVAAIDKRAGEGKNALLALLSLPVVKNAVVVDSDVDIYDPVELEWTMTFRVQPDRDVLIVTGAKAKHVDPSVRPWELKPGELPLTAKMGIDATLPEGADPARFERLKQIYLDQVDGEAGGGQHSPAPAEEVAAQIEALLRARPHYFHELLAGVPASYRSFIDGWLLVRARHALARDESGHYSLSAA